jgi:hypothetical protein
MAEAPPEQETAIVAKSLQTLVAPLKVASMMSERVGTFG